jgi:hypothetical protein
MHRREFMRSALVGSAVVPMLRLVPGFVRERQSTEESGSTVGTNKIRYIREKIPAFDMPPYRGETYEDLVPDTYDLAHRAELAINNLTRQTDPALDYDIYILGVYYHNPPFLAHKLGDVVTQPYIEESLSLLRMIAGTNLNDQVDRTWTEGILKSIGPDGLCYMAAEGRPWIRTGTSWWPNVLYPDGRAVKTTEAEFSQVTNQEFCGRIIGVMTLRYLRDKNPMWKQSIERMIDRWSELAINKGDYCYYPVALLCPNAKIDPSTTMPTGTLGGETGDRLIQGLAQYYRVSGYEPAAVLAKKLSNYVRHHAVYFDPQGRYLSGNLSKPEGHFEAHSFGLLALLEHAVAVNDRDLAGFVKSSYEWSRDEAYGCSLIGWFPESVPPSTEAMKSSGGLAEDLVISASIPSSKNLYKSPKISSYTVCETCGFAEMIALGLKLTDAGVGDYWDDVDRWVRNELDVAQVVETGWVYSVAKTLPAVPLNYNETDEDVEMRTLGAFSGYTTGNDYGIDGGAYAPGDVPTGVIGCCIGNATRAIYYVWQRMLRYQDEQLRVNLLLNRAAASVDVHSYIPYEGRVDLKIKKPCQNVLVRAPEWVESHSTAIGYELNGRRHRFEWEGRYLASGPFKPGDTVTLTFPISERIVSNVRIGGSNYTLILKGNTVVSVDPPGRFYPIYQRSQYRSNRVPWRKVMRFVSEEELAW